MTYPAPLLHYGSFFDGKYSGSTYSVELCAVPLPFLSEFFRRIDLSLDPRFVVTAVGRSYVQTATSKRDSTCA